MKIKIRHNKLFGYPYREDNKESFIFDDDLIEQIKQSINKGNPSTYLISGYRGTGKTSLISRIESEAAQNVIFANISFAKYDKYSLILRKIIRALFNNFIESKSYESLNVANKEFVDRFSLLYKRTFSDINFLNNKRKIKSWTSLFKFTLNIKYLISLIVLLCLSFSNIITTFIYTDLAQFISIFVLALTIILILFETIDFKFLREVKKEISEEENSKTFYDDEIAEHYLLEILTELKNHNVKIVFVIDEIDKIENLEKIKDIINDLKALLLSGLGDFIIIAGQKLYYVLLMSYSEDDPVISSLFSKSFHVRLFNYATLKNYFYNLIDDSTNKSSELLSLYIDSMILESKRVQRKLVNLIKTNEIWENNEAFLEVKEEYKNKYETDSKILFILNKIIDNGLVGAGNDEVLTDFLTSQLHVWIHKMNYLRIFLFTKMIYLPYKNIKN